MRLLLIEDDESLGQGLLTALRRAGYAIDWLTDGAGAIAALQSEPIDALILDLGLPGRDGLEVLADIRAAGIETPVIILTARDAIPDRIRGLDAGADDYLAKPFDIGELKARVRALLRRREGRTGRGVQLGDLEIDLERHEASWQGRPLDLSRRELALLNELVLSPGRVLTRDSLLQKLYGWDEDVSANTLEVHVHNLRKKLPVDLIRTVRGVGYTARLP